MNAIAEDIKTKMVSAWNNEMETAHHDFGCTDERGRAMGADITTGTHEFAVIEGEPQQWTAWFTIAPGTHFYFRPHATRNGRGFGALQSARYFSTKQERETAIQKYLADAKKRAAKRK